MTTTAGNTVGKGWFSFDFTGGTAYSAHPIASVLNPEGADVVLSDAIIYITPASTGSANINVGLGTATTGDYYDMAGTIVVATGAAGKFYTGRAKNAGAQTEITAPGVWGSAEYCNGERKKPNRRPMRLRICLMLVTSALASAWPAASSSFSIFENGVRASGMAGAFVAIANDGSAIFYNPAGIAFQKGTRMEMDGLGVVGLFRFYPSDTPTGTVVPEKGYNLNVKPHIIPVANLYFTKDLSPRVTFGFGVFAPFGLAANATSFKDSDPTVNKYVGRYAGSRADLQSIWMQPTVAYRLTPNSSIGVGVAFVHTHLHIEQSIINPLDDGVVFGEELASKIFPGLDKTQAGRSIAGGYPSY